MQCIDASPQVKAIGDAFNARKGPFLTLCAVKGPFLALDAAKGPFPALGARGWALRRWGVTQYGWP
jgi:hypothetical protein